MLLKDLQNISSSDNLYRDKIEDYAMNDVIWSQPVMVGHLPSVDIKLQPSKLQVATIEADNQAAFHQVQWSAGTAVLRGVERLSGVSNEFAYQWRSHPTKRRMLLKLAVSALMNDCFWPIFEADEYSIPAAHLAITPPGVPSIEGMVSSVSKRL